MTMTMDIANVNRSDIKNMPSPKIDAGDEQTVTKPDIIPLVAPKNGKRSFDVAFLMLPDEKLKQKQLDKLSRVTDELHSHAHYPASIKSDHHNLDQSQPEARVFQQFDSAKVRSAAMELLMVNGGAFRQHTARYPQFQMGRMSRVYDDPSLLQNCNSVNEHMQNFPIDLDSSPKSAFTKVSHSRITDSPQPPLSPDQLSCPSSSPPISTSPPRITPNYVSFREYPFMNASNQFHAIGPIHAITGAKMMKHHLMYRPVSQSPPNATPQGYSGAGTSFSVASNAPHPFIQQQHQHQQQQHQHQHTHQQQQQDITGIVRHPAAAAAILSTLIPPTLASTFSLTAQNVCAKCNISFRMTSDLVYHMRSHHKNDIGGDINRRKREEKLKCPVCNESFRERHHLTRHMTAHQDKEGDDTDHPTRAATTATTAALLDRRHKMN